MKLKTYLLIILLALAGGNYALAQQTEKRDVSAFTEISLRNDANVLVTQGKNFSVTVTGKESTLEKLITEVRERKLVIRYPNDTWIKSWNPGEVTIRITMPQIDGLSISGSGNITADGEISSTILDIAVSGSGTVKVTELKTDKVTISLSGSGNVILAGQDGCSNLGGVISGSGNIRAIDFPVNNVDVKIAGSGNCYTYAKENLVVKIAGSGNAIYRGNPSIDSVIAGSGAVREQK